MLNNAINIVLFSLKDNDSEITDLYIYLNIKVP